MLKLAFFVEGQTELIFVEYLIDEYFTHPFFTIESYQLIGNRAKTITKRKHDRPDLEYYFLIFDVSGDSRVLSAINERAEYLITRNGYNGVIGLRDIYPNKKKDMKQIRSTFKMLFEGKSYSNKVKLSFAIMETEAWLLADYKLFERIDNRLTADFINKKLNINIDSDNLENYPKPSATMQNIFKLIDRNYKKKKRKVEEICSNINFENLCLNESNLSRIKSFKTFLKYIDKFTE